MSARPPTVMLTQDLRMGLHQAAKAEPESGVDGRKVHLAISGFGGNAMYNPSWSLHPFLPDCFPIG